MSPTSVEVPELHGCSSMMVELKNLVDALHGKRRTLIFDIN